MITNEYTIKPITIKPAVIVSSPINVNEVNEQGSSALHMAATSRSKDDIKNIIAMGANIFHEDMFNESPLISAFHRPGYDKEKYEVIELLLSEMIGRGFNINDKSHADGISLLEYAIVEVGDDIVVKSLLKLGANPMQRNEEGYRMIDMAILAEDENIMDLFHSKGFEYDEESIGVGLELYNTADHDAEDVLENVYFYANASKNTINEINEITEPSIAELNGGNLWAS